jgi:chromosomal replication initiation ATPase DnaA
MSKSFAQIKAEREAAVHSAHAICKEILERHGVTWAFVFSKTRVPEVVSIRVECMFQLRAAGWSYSRIARAAGLDHTTIMAHCKKASARFVQPTGGQIEPR